MRSHAADNHFSAKNASAPQKDFKRLFERENFVEFFNAFKRRIFAFAVVIVVTAYAVEIIRTIRCGGEIEFSRFLIEHVSPFQAQNAPR